MFDRLTLSEDLVDCRGDSIAPRGCVISPEAIREATSAARPGSRHRVGDTPLAADMTLALEASAYQHLFGRSGAGQAVERLVLAAELPGPLLDELTAMRTAAPALYRHGVLTAAVAVRMLLASVGETRALPDVASAALVHDLGMRHLPPTVLTHCDRLPVELAHRIAAHPLLGAYHLAVVLGNHPAVAAAQGHHWRCGQGYPVLSAAPSRSVEVIAVASAFAALTQPRPYRSSAYDARGAADVLVGEAMSGHADGNSVKLLVHALRGGDGDPRAVRFGGSREGHAPAQNHHAPVDAPVRGGL
jgi:HD-GYP domain-containing protein (c-di-GMP phosphodiesterase class II)